MEKGKIASIRCYNIGDIFDYINRSCELDGTNKRVYEAFNRKVQKSFEILKEAKKAEIWQYEAGAYCNPNRGTYDLKIITDKKCAMDKNLILLLDDILRKDFTPRCPCDETYPKINTTRSRIEEIGHCGILEIVPMTYVCAHPNVRPQADKRYGAIARKHKFIQLPDWEFKNLINTYKEIGWIKKDAKVLLDDMEGKTKEELVSDRPSDKDSLK